jgi:diamine N-acetyltransferase
VSPVTFSVRLARTDELKIIQDLNRQLFDYSAKSDPVLDFDWPYAIGAEYFRKAIAGDRSVCFVAESDSHVVGYLAGSVAEAESYRKTTRTELDNMFVIEEFRQHGIGKQLIKRFIAWSMEQKVERILVSSYADNHSAIEFYQSAGFKPYDLALEMELGHNTQKKAGSTP